MKIGSLYLWLALILSVSLNGIIVFWGVRMYRSEVLAISQNAGSDSTAMEFTLAVVASSVNKPSANDPEEQLKEDEILENLDNLAKLETFGKKNTQRKDEGIVEEIREHSSGNSGNIIAVETSNPDAKLVSESQSVKSEVIASQSMMEQPEKITSQDKRESQDYPKKQENITKQETAKSQTRTDSKSTSKPQAIPKSQNVSNPQKAQNRETANARSGDQFALELAANIHSRIEGCYPESSKRRGEEGIVFLKILNQNARLSVGIVKSSGFTRLDRCAVSAVEKILPALNAQEVPISGITLKPIRFQLR